MNEYLIIANDNTYYIFWSDNENGWMYEIHFNKTLSHDEVLDTESDDGGCCTGKLFDAFEMAGINNK